MATTPSTLSGSTAMHAHSVAPHHRRQRLRAFILPNGRRVHIASSPEEVTSLRQQLSRAPHDPSEPFDLVLNGSPEHLAALQHAHSHHTERREALRRKHGEELLAEFEDVRNELETLALELHNVTDHAVKLDANFGKFGYSAHLRTYDEWGGGGSSSEGPGSGAVSSRSSLHDSQHEPKDWEAERRNGRIMKLYKKPVVRQYFHKGLLWRASESTEVASFELFLDLLYVGILAINGDRASESPDGHELLRFAITFILSWKIWSDVALIISWFETDDILQRLSVLFVMTCLLGLTVNMLDAFEDTYTQLVSFYLTARFFMCAYFIILSYTVPMVRGMLIVHAILILIPSALWVASIHIDMPQRLGLIWVAITLDFIGSAGALILVRVLRRVSTDMADWLDEVFEFYPAMNIEHKVERTNAFVTLVFGYIVVAIIYQNAASFGLNAFFGKAVLGLIQAFAFNWIYFELDAADLFSHAIRRSIYTSLVWIFMHVPFIMSFILAGAALSKLVLATDCSDTSLTSLMESYQEKADSEIPIGLRWFYCAGYGIGLFCMGAISVCHVHKDSGGFRLRKKYRLVNRAGVCLIFICLPLVESLSSLQLISVATGLVLWVLLLELWGMSCPDETFFGEKKQCKYTAMCSKRQLDSVIKKGKIGKLNGLDESGEKGLA